MLPLDITVGAPVKDLSSELDFGSGYPTVDADLIVTGYVDANYPETFNGGNWEAVNDEYAMATAEGE